MRLSYSIEGNGPREVVALARLQSCLPGSEIDFDRHQIAVMTNGRSAAEIMPIPSMIPGISRVYWEDGNKTD